MRKILKNSKCCIFCDKWEGGTATYIPGASPSQFEIPQIFGHCRHNKSMKQSGLGTCSKFCIDIKYEKYFGE